MAKKWKPLSSGISKWIARSGIFLTGNAVAAAVVPPHAKAVVDPVVLGSGANFL
jgi:hypothetical protein